MRYCTRCCYPENAKPTIVFDEQGVCSGCRMHESRENINWKEREEWFVQTIEKFKQISRERENIYDCVVPVSGGKDSFFQAYIAKKYGLNPLLVTFNHTFNTKVGIYNLQNMAKKIDCDLLRFTPNENAVRRISKHMLKTVGDVDWHSHAGIMTFPIQAAVMYNIPLVVWGEHGFAELTGMFNMQDMVEFTKKCRQEHSMRGFEPEDIIGYEGITRRDIAPYIYPKEEDIERVGVTGIYISNYFFWDGKAQAELLIDQYDFRTARQKDRTFNLYDKLDGLHQCGTHDFLKYLKFGYGRATDDASMEIRHGRMTREEGIEMVKQYDHVRPSDLDVYLDWVGMTEDEFMEAVEPMRDLRIWEKDTNGSWQVKDSIVNHLDDKGVDAVRLPVDKTTAGFKQNLPPYYWEREGYMIL
jgi:N-acetyl sugar amidotransferase